MNNGTLRYRVLQYFRTPLSQLPFLEISIPAKYPGPDCLQSVIYLIQEKATDVISLESIAACTVSSNSLIIIIANFLPLIIYVTFKDYGF